MKKLLVLVVAALAIAGSVTMAYADQDVWKDSWTASYPAVWMGEKQDPNLPTWGGYGSNNGADHALAYSPFVFGGTQGTVVQYDYTMSKESWSGEVVTVNGNANATSVTDLSAYSQLKFKVAIPAGGPSVVVQKFTMTDANGIEHSVGPITINTSDFSQEYTIDLAGLNLTSVAKLFGVIITKAENDPFVGPDKRTFYIDDIRYVGGGRGEVIVKVTGGKRGISIGGTINFGTVQASQAATGVRSEALTPAQNFIVTNIGDYQLENAVLTLVNPAGWTNDEVAPLAGANNIYALAAVFNQVAPVGDIYNDTNDFLSTNLRQATWDGGSGGNFEGDASVTYENSGYQIPYNNGSRNLWVKFWPPSTTSTNAEMKIYIEIGF